MSFYSKDKDHSLPYYLLIVWRIFVGNETQTSRIWIWVVESISNANRYYTHYIYIYIYIYKYIISYFKHYKCIYIMSIYTHYICIYIHKFNWAKCSWEWPMAPFSIATTLRWRRGATPSFAWIAPFTLDQYLIRMSVNQGGIKYHYWSLWYELSWDLIPVSCTISEHCNHYANGLIYI